MQLIVVTAIGRDRPGIVAGFSGALYRAGCNLQDCTMTRLGGEFAMILLVRVPEDQEPSILEEKLAATSQELGLTTLIRRLPPEEAEPPGLDCPAYILRVYGADRPGIVSEVTELLARYSWNITDLSSQLLGGPTEASAGVYVMMLEVEGTPETAERLQSELSELRGRLGVEIALERLQAEAL